MADYLAVGILIPEFFQFLQERINILETPVNRCKTDISHFIHFPQSCQSQLTNGLRGNFPLHGILQFCFDIGHQLFQLFHRYRTLFTGTQNTAQLYDRLGMAEYQAIEVFVKMF